MAKKGKFIKSDISHKTLFVRGIPQNCTNEQLLEEFCKTGPIKDCFVVNPKCDETKPKQQNKLCIGYVTYLSSESAKEAIKDPKQFMLNGKNLQISLSLRKSLSKKAYLDKYEGANKTVSFESTEKDKKEIKEINTVTSTNKKLENFPVIVSGFPSTFSENDIKEIWKKSKFSDPASVDIIPDLEESNKNIAKVMLSSKQEALKSCHHLMGKTIDNGKGSSFELNVVLYDGDDIALKTSKKSKLIVRNLSFKCDEDNLKQIFQRYGKVTDVKIPTKSDGRKRGFGFVQYTNVFEAMKAMKGLNMKEILGRKVAIDWALPKEKFVDMTKSSGSKEEENSVNETKENTSDSNIKTLNDNNDTSNKNKSSKEDSDDSMDEDNEDDVDDDDDDSDSEDNDSEKSDSGEDSSLETDEETNDNQYKKEFDKVNVPASNQEERKTLFFRNLSGETTEDQVKKAFSKFGKILYVSILKDKKTGNSKGCGFVKFKSKEKAESCLENNAKIEIDNQQLNIAWAKSKEDKESINKVPSPKKNPASDIHEGKTIFLRNLSFDSEEEDITDVLKEYGELVYVRIVKDRNTGMSKGCAFAKFEDPESAKRCIDEFGENTAGLLISSRMVTVCPAMTRTDSVKLSKDKKKKEPKEDKRNLYLAREGLIRPGTQAAEGLSEVEMKKRERNEAAKRQKLKNPNIVVSKTRLCVHNLPRATDDKKLKVIFLDNVSDVKPTHIKESRIMRDMNQVNSEGIGRSLGYGFVEFKSHEQALRALRIVNNNPKIFNEMKRPIVEFALENSRVLAAKEMRKERSKQKLFLKRKMREDIDAEGDKKKIKFNSKDRKNRNLRNKQSNKAPVVLPKEHSYQGTTGTTISGKKLPLPLHSKAKIRNRNKAKVLDQLRRSKKLNVPKNIREKKIKSVKKRKVNIVSNESDMQSRRKKNKQNDEKEFTKLVSKYTAAILSNSNKKGNKWFE